MKISVLFCFIIVAFGFISFSTTDASPLLKVIKRSAHKAEAEKYSKTQSNNDCEAEVTIKRPCSYEECLERRYPNIAICRRWNELNWDEKLQACPITVSQPCTKK